MPARPPTAQNTAMGFAVVSLGYGFTRPGWTAATLVSGGIATYFLSRALLTFDVGVGYAIWTAVAGVGIVILGAVVFAQRLDWRRLVGIVAVIAGVIGLQLSGAA